MPLNIRLALAKRISWSYLQGYGHFLIERVTIPIDNLIQVIIIIGSEPKAIIDRHRPFP
jgi:hypothetical protein